MTVGQRSPDGRFWWDGSAWRPVQTAPPPPPSARKSLALPLAAMTAGALVLGIVLGGGAGWLTTEPRAGAAALTFGDDFPDVDDQYLPGVTLTLIVDEWMKKANSYTCTNQPGDPDTWSKAKQRMRCLPPDGQENRYVDIEYDAARKIRVLKATCRLGVRAEACTTLFATMADAALVPQPELRKRAMAWATKNAAGDRGTIIGGIRLQADLSPHSLRLTPES